MFCNHCGRVISDDSMFCSLCGNKVVPRNIQSRGSPPVQELMRHPSGRYQQQKWSGRKQKGKAGRVFGYCVAGVATIFLILVLIGLLSDAPDEDPMIRNTAKNVSGKVQIGNATIALPKNAEAYSINIVERKPYRENMEENLVFFSNVYEIQGYLDRFNHNVEVEIALTDEQVEMVRNTPGLAERTSIVWVEEIYTSSYGVSHLQRRLDSNLDVENGTIKASLDLSGGDLAMRNLETDKNSKVPLGWNHVKSVFDGLVFTKALAENVEAVSDVDQRSSFGFQIKSYRGFWEQVLSDDNRFRIVYDAEEIQRECIPILLEDLQASKTFLEDLGFSFDMVSQPIYVEIKDLDGKIGEYKGSKFLRSLDALYIDQSNFIMNVDGYMKLKRQEVKVTAAHELFHLVQSYYNPQTRLKQNHPWGSKPFLWLEEAASTWIEPKVAGEGYMPDNVVENLSFINSSLAFTENGEHGYGAALFLRYIEGKTDKESVFHTFLYAKMNADPVLAVSEGASMSAFDQVMGEVYQKSTDELWIDFTKSYFLEPKSIYPWLDTTPVKNKSVSISAKTIPLDEKKSDVEFDFKTNVSRPMHITGLSKGTYLSQVNAKAQIQCMLDNLSADYVTVGFSNKHNAFNWKGAKLKISVHTTGKTGVMVYDSKHNRISGDMWAFMSSNAEDERFQGSHEIIIENFKREGTGEIIMIPFNFDASDEKRLGTVDIQVTYLPGEKPEDPPDSDETDDPGQGGDVQIPQTTVTTYPFEAVAGTYVDVSESMTEKTVLGRDGTFTYTAYDDENEFAHWVGSYELVYPEGGFVEGDEIPLFYIEAKFSNILDDYGEQEWTWTIYEQFVKDGKLVRINNQTRVN